MELFLDGGRYRVTSDDRQLILSKRCTCTNRDTKEKYTTYSEFRYFNQPSNLFKYLLWKGVCDSEARSLLDAMAAAERRVMAMVAELDREFKAIKGGSDES